MPEEKRKVVKGMAETHKYCIGLDYGTLSARAILVDVRNGDIVSESIFNYPHGVMENELTSGVELGENQALQDPKDYIDALYTLIPDILKKSDVSPQEVIGIGVDFTACTVLPIYNDGTPLCFTDEFKNEPNAYVKLWKSHSAQKYATRLNEILKEKDPKLLKSYGGSISSEWLMPKVLQTIEEAPAVYEKCDKIMEAGDFITYILTGNDVRNSCAAGYKGLYGQARGNISKEVLSLANPLLGNVEKDKLGKVVPSGSCVGKIKSEIGKKLGLGDNVAVASAIIDAHAAVPACGIFDAGKMLMIMGTSTCHMLLDKKYMEVGGISGSIYNGVIENYYCYEAGQCAVGDVFQWVVDNITPAKYFEEAKSRGVDIHTYLSYLSSQKDVGESGIVCLDWLNGNRSVLMDSTLRGVVKGVSLSTSAPDIYRAMIEATAFGTKKIIENYEESGVAVKELYACGGIAAKNPVLMQIYADIIGIEIKVISVSQTVALGSAIFGAYAAGSERGGYDTLEEAGEKMSAKVSVVYRPIKKNNVKYDRLYAEYMKLHDFFGKHKA